VLAGPDANLAAEKQHRRLDPILSHLVNWSLEHGSVPSSFMQAYVTSQLKDAYMDSPTVASYRRISNLPVPSKLLERLVVSQLVRYLKDNAMLPDLQSAYRAYHSTETAILRVLAGILQALNTKHSAAMVYGSICQGPLLTLTTASYSSGCRHNTGCKAPSPIGLPHT
jgi:hypothetical protein